MKLAQELCSALEEWGVGPVDLDTSLIRSGMVDSTALFNLACWIEERSGRAIDPSTVDLAHEWDSVRSIVRFVSDARAR